MSEVTPIIRPDGSVVIPIYNEQTGSATPIEDVSPEKVAYISQADKDKLDSISVSSLVYIETLESTASELLIQIESKQPSGDYSVNGHTHSISAVDNLQLELDSKQPSGNYVELQTLEATASELLIQIDSKQPSGDYANTVHTHAISSVDNLQLELDSKQPSGDYSVVGHSHTISAVDNLQSTLDSKQPSGNYADSVHTHSISSVDNLQTNLDSKLNNVSNTISITGSYASSALSASDSGVVLSFTTSGTLTLETYTNKPYGFQIALFARNGIVTISGTNIKSTSNYTKVPDGGWGFVYRDLTGWDVGGVTS